MEQAAFSPYPYLSWLGTWRATGRNEKDIEFGMQQVAHVLIYTTRGKADVLWEHGGREDRFRVDAGTVRFCPADDEYHTLIGRRCESGHRFYTLLIPRGHLVQLADTEGISAMPELRHSVSTQDAVLTSCMRTLSNAQQHLDEASLERREAAALSLILRLLSKNGWKGPDWQNDNSVFPRRTLDGLVAYIDDHLHVAPSLQEMCMRVGMSPSHFGKKFRQSTGLSLHRFINYRRIRKSLRMLTADSAPLKSIGATLGFSSHSHFTRMFTELTGMTPVKYRQQFKRRDMPKGRESGMPKVEVWQGFFDPAHVLDRLDCQRAGNVVEFGCGYGLFTVEAAKRSSGTVYALDIDPEMIAATTESARKAGVANVQPMERDFVADATGLPSQTCDYAMVFNLLHIDEPVALLREAFRILQSGGRLGIIHWAVDSATPRGPSMDIRPTPVQCRRWAEEAGFRFVREEPGIAKWHWGLLMQRP